MPLIWQCCSFIPHTNVINLVVVVESAPTSQLIYGNLIEFSMKEMFQGGLPLTASMLLTDHQSDDDEITAVSIYWFSKAVQRTTVIGRNLATSSVTFFLYSLRRHITLAGVTQMAKLPFRQPKYLNSEWYRNQAGYDSHLE